MDETERTMTVSRALLVLAFFTVVGVTIVALRADSARAAHRVQLLHQREVRQRERLWGLEMDLAGLRAPGQIRRRIEELGLDVRPPPPDRPAAGSKAPP